MKNYHGAGRVVNLPAVDLSSWTMHIPEEVTAFVFDKSLSMDERYGKAIDLALQFDPDLVLCVGPYSSIASAFYSVRPVLALPTNTASFLGCADIWLRGSDFFMTENEVTWQQEFPMPLSVMHPYRIFLENAKFRNLTRTQLGISEDAVVLVTVGFRLSSEITPAWADQMCDLIAHYEQVVWVLIGDATPSCLSHLSPKKIINLGIQSRTVNCLDLCDVYVNPPRMGGGFSVLEAMGKARAVVSYADSDGGEKIGVLAVNDEDEYFAKLHRLILNPEQRVHEGRQLAQRFFALYDLKQSQSSLVNACRLAVNHFKERIISTV
ncbi:hypothetical protein PHIN6_07760 [Polynucleobacter sp. HIN6]|nr:hypothetical protein PHIN6_07760 [Polynucleobacter sp. HIN6]